jgi:hypothetical protein
MVEDEDLLMEAEAEARREEARRQGEAIFSASVQSYLGKNSASLGLGLPAGTNTSGGGGGGGGEGSVEPGSIEPECTEFEKFLRAEWPEDYRLLQRAREGDPACGRTYGEWRRLFDSALSLARGGCEA